ncbi:MAG TPA: hypothetical protein VMT18_05610, partial [Planctomycetota bacterium]|nr:hypothetical protein [Planctomycetota bacterium]
MIHPCLPARRVLAVALGLSACAASARAQVALSFDYQGPSVSQTDPVSGQQLSECDVLRPSASAPTFGPLGVPQLVFSGQALGLQAYTGCLGHAAGTPCGIEVDALSDGRDALPTPDGTPMPLPPAQRWWFSVDEHAGGQGIPTPGHASVLSEAPVGDACADVFVDTGLTGGPLPPGAVAPHSAGTMDGNGLPSATGFTYFGLGLVEPNPPTTTLPEPGDNLDALDIGLGAAFPTTGIFLSLDAAFPDPLTGKPASSSAQMQGFRGADVLLVPASGVSPVLYASAQSLGLDLLGPGTDDLDALIVGENGVAGFQPPRTPFAWLNAAGSDMLMFSVRRGSAVVGAPDSIFGLPIEPGDVLMPPVAGGLSPFPGIFIAAENLGLATVRSGTALLFGDDMDALETTDPPCFDCNGNGVEDSVDISTGASSDGNGNGIPDECEQTSGASCTCPLASAPCGNDDDAAGCANSTGAGGTLTAGGTTSVFADDLSLVATQLPTNQFGIVFMGTSPASAPFGDGLR